MPGIERGAWGGEELPRLSPGVGCDSTAQGDKVTYNHFHSYVTFIIINQVLVLLVIFCDFAECFFLTVFMLCNKYNTCILTTVVMYYTIFIVAVPYSLDLFISSSSLLCKTCMLLFALLAVTFYPTARVKSNISVSLRFDP